LAHGLLVTTFNVDGVIAFDFKLNPLYGGNFYWV
jgi:hypothetical protein